jgi:hypothetical protein
MIEADLAHLRFLHGRSRRGDMLNQEDFEFCLNLENQIQSVQNQICLIMAAEGSMRANL